MITKFTHVTIFVLDQQQAHDFYVNTLGFKVHTDAPMGEGQRWLTLTTPMQPDLEIILMPVVEGMMFKGPAVDQMRELVGKGTLGSMIFECDDLQATYEELSAKGVVFKKPPTKEFYGMEAIFEDNSGNWFSLGQKGEG